MNGKNEKKQIITIDGKTSECFIQSFKEFQLSLSSLSIAKEVKVELPTHDLRIVKKVES